MKQKLIVSSRNAHKVEEIRAMLPEMEVCDLSVLPEAPEVEETGATFSENAALKALAISDLTDAWVLADDSGLEVDALGGAPGVYSARYAGVGGDDAANNEKLMKELAAVADEKRTARFRCVIVLAKDGMKRAEYDGSVEGWILHEKQGEGGFGYDPLFRPEGYEESFAQLGEAVKNTLSHRARAMEGVREFFQND